MADITYDAGVIREFAAHLYARARWLVFWSTASGIVIGFVAGTALNRDTTVAAWSLACLGAAIGHAVGQTRAFRLRLQAQTALCQVQIEINTRVAAAHATALVQNAPANSNGGVRMQSVG